MDDFTKRTDLAEASREDHIRWMRALADKADEQAFANLFSFFAPRVKSYLMREGAADDEAEEIAQDVMATVWRKARLYDPAAGAVSTWIFRIARNRRIDVLRKGNKPELDAHEPMFQPPAEPDPDSALSGAERDEIVRDAITQLPEEQRETLRLAFYEGFTHSEIAEVSGIPLGTVKSRFRLAFKKLKETLDRNAV